MAAISSVSSTDWAALRQAQAGADRADDNSRAIERQASDARRDAVQAQQRADRLAAESDQARSDAAQARSRLASMGSLGTRIDTLA